MNITPSHTLVGLLQALEDVWKHSLKLGPITARVADGGGGIVEDVVYEEEAGNLT